jgi:hypothetical protein
VPIVRCRIREQAVLNSVLWWSISSDIGWPRRRRCRRIQYWWSTLIVYIRPVQRVDRGTIFGRSLRPIRKLDVKAYEFTCNIIWLYSNFEGENISHSSFSVSCYFY